MSVRVKSAMPSLFREPNENPCGGIPTVTSPKVFATVTPIVPAEALKFQPCQPDAVGSLLPLRSTENEGETGVASVFAQSSTACKITSCLAEAESAQRSLSEICELGLTFFSRFQTTTDNIGLIQGC